MLDGLVRRHTDKQESEVGGNVGAMTAPGSLLAGSFSAPRADGHGEDFLGGLSSTDDGAPSDLGDLTVGVRGPLGLGDSVD